jgi:hypothetical protein
VREHQGRPFETPPKEGGSSGRTEKRLSFPNEMNVEPSGRLVEDRKRIVVFGGLPVTELRVFHASPRLPPAQLPAHERQARRCLSASRRKFNARPQLLIVGCWLHGHEAPRAGCVASHQRGANDNDADVRSHRPRRDEQVALSARAGAGVAMPKVKTANTARIVTKRSSFIESPSCVRCGQRTALRWYWPLCILSVASQTGLDPRARAIEPST